MTRIALEAQGHKGAKPHPCSSCGVRLLTYNFDSHRLVFPRAREVLRHSQPRVRRRLGRGHRDRVRQVGRAAHVRALPAREPASHQRLPVLAALLRAQAVHGDPDRGVSRFSLRQLLEVEADFAVSAAGRRRSRRPAPAVPSTPSSCRRRRTRPSGTTTSRTLATRFVRHFPTFAAVSRYYRAHTIVLASAGRLQLERLADCCLPRHPRRPVRRQAAARPHLPQQLPLRQDQLRALYVELIAPTTAALADLSHLTDDPEVFKNAPIGLQCIMRRGEDEAVIRVVEMVDEALKAQK